MRENKTHQNKNTEGVELLFRCGFFFIWFFSQYSSSKLFGSNKLELFKCDHCSKARKLSRSSVCKLKFVVWLVKFVIYNRTGLKYQVCTKTFFSCLLGIRIIVIIFDIFLPKAQRYDDWPQLMSIWDETSALD